MIKSKYLFTVYKISLLILAISSMYPWFFARVSSFYIAIYGLLISFILYLKERNVFKVENGLRPSIFLLFIVLMWNGLHATIVGFFECILNFFILYCVLCLKNEYKKEILFFITKYFAIGILFSLVVYLLWFLGIGLPHTEGSNSQGYVYSNYYLMTIHHDYEDGIVIPRFQSVFLEPGHLTMGVIPFLCANRLNLRNKYVLILFVAELLTFSLAGYICLSVMILYYIWRFLRTRKSVMAFLSVIILLVSSYNCYTKVSDDSIVYQMIVSRVQNYSGGNYSDQMGDRFKDNTIKAYNLMMSSVDMFWGYGLTDRGLKAQEGSSGYKVYMILYGVGGLLLLVLFYCSYYKRYHSTRGSVFLIVYVMLFLQNGYPFWYIVIITYLLGLPYLKETKIVMSNGKDFVLSPNQ